MADVDYDYSLTNDFDSCDSPALDRLELEINTSDIVTQLAVDENGNGRLSVLGDNCKIWFKAALSSGDETLLEETIVADHDGTPLVIPEEPSEVEVVNAVASDLRTDSRVTMFSPNLCDKCSWYQDSTEVIEETLTPDENYETYSSQHSHWIDLYHGRVSDEDDLVDDYAITVTVNDVAQTMDAPFGAGGDGDFSIDPVAGTITFHTDLTGSDVVKVSYHYAGTSEWVMKPDSGKNLELFAAECQMSKNVVMNDTIRYQVFMLGQYCGGPPDQLVPIKTKKYKNARDFINESNGAYPEVPSFGGSVRGISNPVLIFPWLYKTKTMLYSAYGMEIRVSLVDDEACDGELAVVTFYCISSNA